MHRPFLQPTGADSLGPLFISGILHLKYRGSAKRLFLQELDAQATGYLKHNRIDSIGHHRCNHGLQRMLVLGNSDTKHRLYKYGDDRILDLFTMETHPSIELQATERYVVVQQ